MKPNIPTWSDMGGGADGTQRRAYVQSLVSDFIHANNEPAQKTNGIALKDDKTHLAGLIIREARRSYKDFPDLHEELDLKLAALIPQLQEVQDSFMAHVFKAREEAKTQKKSKNSGNLPEHDTNVIEAVVDMLSNQNERKGGASKEVVKQACELIHSACGDSDNHYVALGNDFPKLIENLEKMRDAIEAGRNKAFAHKLGDEMKKGLKLEPLHTGYVKHIRTDRHGAFVRGGGDDGERTR